MSVLTSGLYFLVCVTIVLSRSDVDIESRIVGGTNAEPGEFPYQVSLRKNNNHICSGSIISRYSILTAAHCIYGNNDPITVVPGTNSLNVGGTAYNVMQRLCHPSYSPVDLTNDVAVLNVEGSILFGTFVDILGVQVRLNPLVDQINLDKSVPTAGSPAVLSGWGLTTHPGNIPNALQKIQLQVLDLQTCANWLEGARPITSAHVCTIAPVNQGACQGDSGGPLVSSSGQQIGIVSWGIPCAKGLPDVFTSVAFYRDWIEGVAKY